MREKLIFICGIWVLFCGMVLCLGCKDDFDRIRNIDEAPKEIYRWNPESGKAGEGRCHLVSPDGSLGIFVKSENCGR